MCLPGASRLWSFSSVPCPGEAGYKQLDAGLAGGIPWWTEGKPSEEGNELTPTNCCVGI